MIFKGYNPMKYFRKDDKSSPKREIKIVSVDIAKPQPDNFRGQRSNYIWQPFIDEEGNGCCTNVLTGETYLDWTNEELEVGKDGV